MLQHIDETADNVLWRKARSFPGPLTLWQWPSRVLGPPQPALEVKCLQHTGCQVGGHKVWKLLSSALQHLQGSHRRPQGTRLHLGMLR